MKPIEVIGKRVAIYGMNGTGKTTFLQRVLLPLYPRSVVFDIKRDYEGFHRFIPKTMDYGPEMEKDFNAFVDHLIKEKKYNVCAVDEVNRIAPNKMRMPKGLRYLNDFNGVHHENIGLITIARRPSQVNTDLTALAHTIICFSLDGKQDKQYLEGIAAGLGEAVASLKIYEFVVYNRLEKDLTICKPLDLR